MDESRIKVWIDSLWHTALRSKNKDLFSRGIMNMLNEYVSSQQNNAADGDRSWACPDCGGVHHNIDEYYLHCHFCGYPRC